MAADDQQVKQQLDAIVQTIGFGIVNDYRELRQAMYYANSLEENNVRILGDVNSNLEATERSLDTFEKEVYRRQDARAFRRIEDQLERKSKGNEAYNKETLQRIFSAIENIKAQIGRRSAGFGEGESGSGFNLSVGGGGLVKKAVGVGLLAAGAAAVAVGGVAAYQALSGGESSDAAATPDATLPATPAAAPAPSTNVQAPPSASIAPASAPPPTAQLPSPPPVASATPPSAPPPQASVQPAPSIAAPTVQPQAPSPPPQTSLARQPLSATPVGGAAAAANDMGGATADYFSKSTTSSAVNSATQTVGSITQSSSSRAANKVTSKVSNWMARNGGRIQNVIGASNMQMYGQLIGGNFSFSKFLPGDSWTNAGAEYVAGTSPPIEGGTNEKYVAGVAVTLAIMTYLMCREIYTEENYVAIENGLVPNFDNLPQNQRSQVVKNAGSFVETYVNSLISAASGVSATVSKAPSSPPVPINAPAPAGQPSAASAPAGGAPSGGGGATAPAMGPAGTSADTLPITPPSPAPTGGGGGSSATLPTTPRDGNTGNPASSLAPTSAPTSQQGNARVAPSDNMASVKMEKGLQEGGEAGGVAEILETGPGYNVVRLNDGSVVKRKGDRNWRNNNPGNLEYGETARKYGAIGSDGRFAIFPDKETGNRAREGLLFESKGYKDLTIGQAIYKYAPPSENNSAAYAAQVAQGTGANVNTRLSDLSAEQRKAMMDVMERVEGFKQGQTQVIQAANQRIDEQQAQIDELKNQQTSLTDKAAVKPLPDATVNPAPEDATQASDVTENLSPTTGSGPTGSYGFADNLTDEETSSYETQAYDARGKRTKSGEHPKDVARNKLPTYMDMMQHIFGDLSEEMQSHLDGESSEDDAFYQAMHPL